MVNVRLSVHFTSLLSLRFLLITFNTSFPDVERTLDAVVNKKVLPMYQVDEYLRNVHETLGHRGRDAMFYHILRQNVSIDQLRKLCQVAVDNCYECFTCHRLKVDHVVKKPIVPTHVLHRMQMDFVQLLPDKQGFEYLLTVMDCYSKKAWVRGSLLLAKSLVTLNSPSFSFGKQG